MLSSGISLFIHVVVELNYSFCFHVYLLAYIDSSIMS